MKVVEGRAFIRGSLEDCCIGIERGRIVAIKKIIKGDPHYNFGNKYILPAGIDIHVHFREPGFTQKEDFYSGTKAAACGGITCIFDMPNNLPPTADLNDYEEKLSIVGRKANVDFGLYIVLSEDSEPKELSKAGCPFKIYMVATSSNYAFGDYRRLEHVLKETDVTGLHTSIHCENRETIGEEGRNLREHLGSRPNESEVSAIRIIEDRARGTRVHICHVTAQESIPILENRNLTSEVTPHHLLLNVDSDLGAFGKVVPPLRRKDDQMALWRGLISGKIDIIASDHAPHTIEEKEEGFERAPPGVPGVETSLPLMLIHLKRGNLTIGRLVSAMMERPAQIMGLNKGRIEVGKDADLIAVDLRKRTKIRADELSSKCRWTPYEGWEAIFPIATFLRGELIAEEGEIQETRRGRTVIKREKT